MSTIPLPEDQRRAFATACERDGLHPDGFDVKAVQGDSAGSPLEILVVVGKREYRYPAAAGEHGWIARFFHDIKQIGDPGDGVTGMTSDHDRKG